MNTYVNFPFRYLCCTVALIALLWLTIGFSFTHIQLQNDSVQHFAFNGQSDHNDNAGIPFENSNEETAEISLNDISSEYLKADTEQVQGAEVVISHNRYHGDASFVDFCLDSFSPPPEAFIC